jgi:hypothetical protein
MRNMEQLAWFTKLETLNWLNFSELSEMDIQAKLLQLDFLTVKHKNSTQN